MKTRAIHVRRGVAPLDSGTLASLLPADAEAEAALSKIPLGETIAIKIDRRRSNPQNRLYWAIVEYVADGAGYEDKRVLHKGLLVALGYYDAIRLPNGKVFAEVNSTAFDAMDDDEFQIYMDGAIRLMCTDVIPGTSRDDLIDHVQAMLGTPAQNPADGPPARSPAVGPPDNGAMPPGSNRAQISDPGQAGAIHSPSRAVQSHAEAALALAGKLSAGTSHGDEAGEPEAVSAAFAVLAPEEATPRAARRVSGASMPLSGRPARNFAVKLISRHGVVEWTSSKNALLVAFRGTIRQNFAAFQRDNAENIGRMRKEAPELWEEWIKESEQIIRGGDRER